MQALDQAELTSADVLFMALRDLEVFPSVDSFEARRRIQKLGYILQKCGILPSYGYSWYLQGPYSPELTDDLYTVSTNFVQFMTRNSGRNFVPDARERLEKVKRILGPSMSNTQVLEAIASILYLGPGWEGKLSALKPGLPTESIEQARLVIQELETQNLLELG